MDTSSFDSDDSSFMSTFSDSLVLRSDGMTAPPTEQMISPISMATRDNAAASQTPDYVITRLNPRFMLWRTFSSPAAEQKSEVKDILSAPAAAAATAEQESDDNWQPRHGGLELPGAEGVRSGGRTRGTLSRQESCPADLGSLARRKSEDLTLGNKPLLPLHKSESYPDQLVDAPRGMAKSKSSDDIAGLNKELQSSLESSTSSWAKDSISHTSTSSGLGESVGSSSRSSSRAPSPSIPSAPSTPPDVGPAVPPPGPVALGPGVLKTRPAGGILSMFLSRIPQRGGFETISETSEEPPSTAPAPNPNPTTLDELPSATSKSSQCANCGNVTPSTSQRKVRIKNRDINSWAPNSL